MQNVVGKDAGLDWRAFLSVAARDFWDAIITEAPKQNCVEALVQQAQ